MNQESRCCKCQSTLTIQSSSSRHSNWCRQCFIDQIHIKFFQAFKVAKRFCRPPPLNDQSNGLKNLPKSNQNHKTHSSSSLVIHFENNLSSFVTLHLIKNYLNSNQARSTDKWKSPIDFDSIQVVWVNPGSASEHLSADPSALHSRYYQNSRNNQQPSSTTHTLEEQKEQSKIRTIVESLGFQLVILNLDHLFEPSSSNPPSSLEQSSIPFSRFYVDLSDPNLPVLKIDFAANNSSVIRNLQPHIHTEHDSSRIDISNHNFIENNLVKILRPLTKTSRKSLIEILTATILLNFCKQTCPDLQSPSFSSTSEKKVESSKVLIKCTSSTRLAIDTLLNVSLGNGFCLDQIVGQTSFINDVLICRPIHQILDIELLEYSKFMDLPDHYNSYSVDEKFQSVNDPSINSQKKIDNIDSLITEFIKKIETNYPLTSSVINQTVNKVGRNLHSFSSPTRSHCRICLRSLDLQADQWKRSITLSSHETGETTKEKKQAEKREMKQEQPRIDESDSHLTTEVARQNEKDLTSDRKKEPEGSSLRDDLCFGCLVTFTDHLYSANFLNQINNQTSSDPDWIQLPDYFNHQLSDQNTSSETHTTVATHSPTNTTSQSNHLSSILDEFLLKD